MRILITGGLGFIGSHLANYYLQDSNNEVIIVDNLSTGKLSNVDVTKSNLKIMIYDFNTLNPELNYQFIIDEFKKGIDYVYHYAACVGVDRTLKNPEMVIADMLGIEYLLRICELYKVKKFIFASSSEVYGEVTKNKGACESDVLAYNTPYMIAKRFGEKNCLDFEYNMKTYVLRFFNVYGKNQSNDFVISRLFNKVLRGEKHFLSYGNGDSVRDYVHIDDNINATLFIVENAKPRNIYNICSGQKTYLNDLIHEIEQITDFKFVVTNQPERKDIKVRVGDSTKLEDLGFQFTYNLYNGLKKTWCDICQ